MLPWHKQEIALEDANAGMACDESVGSRFAKLEQKSADSSLVGGDGLLRAETHNESSFITCRCGIR